MHKFSLIFIGLIFSQLSSYSQTDKNLAIKGNKMFDQGNFDEANLYYGGVNDSSKIKEETEYNYANSLYRQKNYQSAIEKYQSIIKKSDNKKLKASSNFNMGNAFMQEKKYQEAVEAYKNSLRLDSKNNETRENLLKAMQFLKQQQEKNQNKDQENQNDQKENKDQENKNNQNKEENKDNSKENNKDKDQKKEEQKNKDQKEKQNQKKPGKLSKEEAEQLLKAYQEQNKETQEKAKEEEIKALRSNSGKDW